MSALGKLEQLRIDLQKQVREKPARAYAAEILQLRTREQRAAALEQVPERHRTIVRFYVATHFARLKGTPLPEFKP